MQVNPNPEPIIIEERITKVNGDFHIKKYARGKFLGKGGFAKVYHFTNLETNKLMAGKVMPKANLNRSRSRQKLMSEIRLHKQLTHQHIVKFEHVFEDSENVYILLELCPHQSLSELLKRRKRLTELEVQCYVIQCVDALKYLHFSRIIHRDLKLGNLFLSDKMQIKLGDFGLATKLEFDGEKKRTICGTPNYIAPEVLDGNIGHSYQVDTWSLGVVAYTLLIGKPPFETNEVKKTYKKIRACEYDFPEIAPISSQAKDLIRKILVADPEKRLTLDEILVHPWINNGGTVPKMLPVSTLTSPPPPNYSKQFAPGNTSHRLRITSEPDPLDILNIDDVLKSPKTNYFSSPRLSTALVSPKGSNDFSPLDIFRQTPKSPKLDFLGSDRFGQMNTMTTMNTMGTMTLGGHERTKSLNTPVLTMTTPKLTRVLSIGDIAEVPEEHIPNQEQAPPKKTLVKQGSDSISEIRVIKWYDYSSKYGLGYVLSNGAVGVFFNDGVKLIAPPGETFEYIVRRSSDKQDVASTYNFKEYPQDIHKRVLVYNRFKEHFENVLKTITPSKIDDFVYVKKWIKTKHATFFRMNNRVLQLAFEDQTVLLMNSDTKKVTYMDAKKHVHKCNVDEVSTSDNKELAKRMKYMEDVLKQIWVAQTDTKTSENKPHIEAEVKQKDLTKKVLGKPQETPVPVATN